LDERHCCIAAVQLKRKGKGKGKGRGVGTGDWGVGKRKQQAAFVFLRHFVRVLVFGASLDRQLICHFVFPRNKKGIGVGNDGLMG
jgi:hypothetical protein